MIRPHFVYFHIFISKSLLLSSRTRCPLFIPRSTIVTISVCTCAWGCGRSAQSWCGCVIWTTTASVIESCWRRCVVGSLVAGGGRVEGTRGRGTICPSTGRGCGNTRGRCASVGTGGRSRVASRGWGIVATVFGAVAGGGSAPGRSAVTGVGGAPSGGTGASGEGIEVTVARANVGSASSSVPGGRT